MSCGKPKYAAFPGICPYEEINPDCQIFGCEWFKIMETDIVNNLQPLVSIIMPYYNGGHTIKKALASIAQQTYKNFEVIIVNDGSDQLHQSMLIQAVGMYSQLSIQVVNQDNKGQAIARNEAFKKTSGEVIAYLDCDDEWKENHLMQRLNELYSEEGIGFVFGEFDMKFYDSFDTDDTYVIEPHVYEREFPGLVANILEIDNPITIQSVVHLRKWFVIAGGFEPGVVCGEDGILWRRMINAGVKWAFSPIPTSYYCKYTGTKRHQHQSFVLKMPDHGVGRHLERNNNGKELDNQDTYKMRYEELHEYLNPANGAPGTGIKYESL
jgi:glycosyltransferase involved in cell wall biosynthesis